jgi:hypothetical protein
MFHSPMSSWVLLDANAWSYLHRGDGLSSADADRLRTRVLTRRDLRFFCTELVEHELWGIVDRSVPEFRATMRLLDEVCDERVLRDERDREAREVRQGGKLDERERFIGGRVRKLRREMLYKRTEEVIGKLAREISTWKAQNDAQHHHTKTPALRAKLDELAPGWSEALTPEHVDHVARCTAMSDLEDRHASAFARCRLPRPIDPRRFPTVYWSRRVWAVRATRVLAEGRSSNKPGTYDHHILAAACAYADVLVSGDGDLVRKLAPVVQAPCRVVLFRNWVDEILAP